MSFLILGSKFVVSEDDSDSVLHTMAWVEETSSLCFSMGTQDLQKLGRVYHISSRKSSMVAKVASGIDWTLLFRTG
jgi:hypothetical protein